jgi:hypothetical protein
MNLANPSALLWAALAIPIVIFYILKIRLRRIPVSTVIFWRQIYDEKKPRSLWQRLRHLISLLVQLAFLCLLIGALAEPFFSWEINQARRVVLVIDDSASMNATDVAPSRLSRAKDGGLSIIEGLHERDEMAIVAAGTQPRVVCGLTGRQRTLRDALTAVGSSDGPTRISEAVALARRLVSESTGDQAPKIQIVVLTDGCSDGAPELAKQDDVRLVSFATRAGNVGISRFQVRRSPLDPTGYEILAEVVNQSDEPASCRFELDLNGVVQDVVPLDLKPNGKWSQVIEKVSVDGGQLVARLTDKADGKIDYVDALAADNRAIALLPKREFQDVRLTRPEPNLFLEKVLEANPLVRLAIVKQSDALAATTASQTKSTPNLIRVFHKTVPTPMPPGPALVIDPSGDCDLWKLGDKLANPIVVSQDKETPLLANVRLENVILPEGRKLTFTAAAGKPRVLAAAVTGDPLLALIERPGGNVAVLTVNLDLGDLPFRTAFPILVSNTLAEFAGGRGELREALATGATTDVALPSSPGIEQMSLRAPNGTVQLLPRGVARTTIGPLDQCGIWSILDSQVKDAKPVEEIACNLASRAESDLRPPDGLPTQTTIISAGVFGGFLARPLWYFLIAAAWLLATLEWFLYQRRWIS